ncbi:MAG: hypothetical protein EOP11_11130 [Proteobacteria bacterium]|nr:MAG: hypothetical protein EOP11_11130 [Pseudomonadota bacterium]
MKASKGYLIVTGTSILAVSAVCFVALFGQFRAVERTSMGHGSEKRAAETIKFLHVGLKDADRVEEAKTRMKAFEALAASGPDSGAMDKVRRAYGPALAIFASKPREAEPRFQMAKKRELMEALVNAYRKEIPNGDIRLRAAYLNILFDTQSSLLNEDDSTEEVFVRRNKERLSALKAATTAADPALQARVANIESIFQGFEKGLDESIKWKAEKKEVFAAVEKSIPKLAREMHGTKDEDLEDFRREFLYTCCAAAAIFFASLIALFVAHKVFRHRSEKRVSMLLRFLREFGHERTDPAVNKEIETLRQDPDWAPVITGALEAENSFVQKYQSLIAVPKSMKVPYIVFSRDKVAKQWNESAAELFGVKEGMSVSFDDLLKDDALAAREGDDAALREMVKNSFASLTDDVFELRLKKGTEWITTELLAAPIASGPMAGGKVYIFRPIRNEAERIDRTVATHLKTLRDYVHKVAYNFSLDGLSAAAVQPEVKAAMEDLDTMKRKIDEREALWKSETGALMDQVVREREILERLFEELKVMREAQGAVLGVVGAVHASDESWHDEVCVLERDLDRWKDARRRLEHELAGHRTVSDKARSYEGEVRTSAEMLHTFLEGYDGVLKQLEHFSEEAKIHSVNLSFVQDQTYREFASHSRAYAHELGRFVGQASELANQVRNFTERHPGSSLEPQLARAASDGEALRSLQEEEERLSAFLVRWKQAGAATVDESERAISMLRQAEARVAAATQLGDTVLLINEQAQGNLARWNN